MNMGRPLEFDPEQALDAAMGVFWASGYGATSVQDLLEAMDLSKSSFYQAFGSKRQLFERCLRRYRENTAAAMLDGLDQTVSGRRFIADMLYSAAGEACLGEKPRGCLVMNTANEFAQQDATVAGWVAQGVNRFTAVFRAAVQRAQKEGEIAAAKDPEALAHYLVSSMSGLKTMVKAGAGEKTVRDIVPLILSALD
ncbi:MAG TPA: TetR/AcrR family transcriptional regulator [Methylococcaceae bacterium]|nr:TetR/AcrR family transcriptional regulator [Methylococcaceae bacterium]